MQTDEHAIQSEDYPGGQLILVFGVLSLFVLGPILGLIAWIKGHKAKKAIDADPGRYRNAGKVRTGRICGIIGTFLGVVEIVILVGLIVAGAFDTAPAKAVDQINQRQASASTPTSAISLDGTWKVSTTAQVPTMFVGYRVNEVLAGVKKTAVGQSANVTGSLTIAGTKATAAEFSVQTATLKSDSDQRDGQYNGRIMETSKFPTATFKLTAPIDFAKTPTGTEKITASATGDLTLHGVTKSVTFDVVGFVSGSEINLAGEIPVTFADYSIQNPSFGPVSTEDHGVLEFLLIFDKAA